MDNLAIGSDYLSILPAVFSFPLRSEMKLSGKHGKNAIL